MSREVWINLYDISSQLLHMTYIDTLKQLLIELFKQLVPNKTIDSTSISLIEYVIRSAMQTTINAKCFSYLIIFKRIEW
jgi:hypothetical protein